MHSVETYRQVAQLHAGNIDQGFLSSLGIPFLSLLYEAIDANESSILLIARHEGHVVGFVTGADGMGAIYRELIRQWPRLFMALLPAMISPRKLWKILEIVLMGKKAHSISDLPNAELLSIAVDPAQRNKGFAKTLYGDLLNQFQRRGVDRFRIVVGESLAEAHRFYTRMGAKPVGQIEVHQGSISIMYVHSISAKLQMS